MATDTVLARRGDGAMGLWAAQRLIEWAAGSKSSKETTDALLNEIEDRTSEFAGPSPTPAERALAECASLAHFMLRMSEANYASATSSGNGLTLNQAKFHLLRIDRAHSRLVSSLKALATIRRLALPAVQINVARQQVNTQQVVSSSPN